MGERGVIKVIGVIFVEVGFQSFNIQKREQSRSFLSQPSMLHFSHYENQQIPSRIWLLLQAKGR